MGIINRFLLFVSMIGLALLSVLVLVLCMGVLPESIWLNEIHYILSRRETVAVSVVLLLVALHLLGVSLRGRAERTHERGDFILLQGAEGGVRVALPAIRAMAERTLLSLHGIRMAKVRAQRVRASKNAPETHRSRRRPPRPSARNSARRWDSRTSPSSRTSRRSRTLCLRASAAWSEA